MARLVASVHSLYKFMKLEGLRHDDPSLLIRTPRQERTLPDVLQPEEVDKFLASIDLSTPNGLRDRALFELIYSCGLRISEAAGLSFDRLYMKERLLRVIGKRKKERIIPFGDEAHHWLSKYLSEARPQLEKIRKSIWCFSTRRARAFRARGIWKRVLGDQGDIGRFGESPQPSDTVSRTHLLAGGADRETVQELLVIRISPRPRFIPISRKSPSGLSQGIFSQKLKEGRSMDLFGRGVSECGGCE